MKKIIFTLIIFLGLVGASIAQTNAGYFTESTKPFGINKPPVGFQKETNYLYGYTTTAGATDTTQYIYTRPLGPSATGVRNSFMGKKVMLGINVTTAFENVNATLVLQVSGDGTNWYDLATLSSDTNPQTTGVTWYLADFSSTYVPYARMKFNASSLLIKKAGRIQFLYAIPQVLD